MYTDGGNATSNICKATIPFLKLPTEIRFMIYDHHLTSEKIARRHAIDTGRWTPIDLLYVCRTIYDEAFPHLYTKGEFVLEARPWNIFGLATVYETRDSNSDIALETFKTFAKSQKIRDLIRHIRLEIHWPSVLFYRYMDCKSDPAASPPTATDHMLKRTLVTAGAMLSGLPNLRIIDVSWVNMTLRVWELEQPAPPKHKATVWLRGLKQVRRGNTKVLIRMPLEGPMSTKELARDQEDRGECLDLLREMGENLAELQGYVEETRC